jgi:primosomal protein N' (replication factor Y) (superfamily II helicase)
VATARPLRLKREEAKRVDSAQAQHAAFVKVWVDTPVSHLDGTYDYLVPERLSQSVKPGIRVGVPFAGRDVEALVLERSDKSEITNLKFISSVISEELVASPTLITLISSISKRWICNPFDVIRSAIPARVASVDKAFTAETRSSTAKELANKGKGEVTYLHLAPHEDPLMRLSEFAQKSQAKGSVLIIVPEDRELELLKLEIPGALILSSSLSRTQRYSNYLTAINKSGQIIIGTRSAIFLTPPDLTTLIVYRENSQSHYEPRHPGWNVRDIALLRQSEEKLSLYFVGYSPSLEMARSIESGAVNILSRKARLQVSTFPQTGSELLPERIFSPIRSALKTGSVLFLVPKKGYASALMCKKCRNLAICSCGGKLSRSNQSAPPACVHCSTTFSTWKCKWCNEDKLVLLGRGAIRHAEEIGRAFPGFPVINSDADTPVKEVTGKSSLVIATQGMAPRCEGGYSAAVLLEGGSFFSYSDLRGQERSREAFFEAAGQVKPGAPVLVAIDSSHPINAALASWNPAHMYKRELADLESLDLPPYTRSLTVDLATSEASTVAEGFKKALLDSRIPASTKVLGPSIRGGDKARIILTASESDFSGLTQFVGEFVKHRAIAKKEAIQVRIDPYSLS